MDRLLRQEEAAELLGLSPRTLEAWRVRGGGPRYVSRGRRWVRYRPSDLAEWLDAHTRRHTSDDGEGAR
jgi:predicted DNA-binding transcriptional regulator AlpA